MDVVRLLPDSVANQIAAGEVIQRPASCLKELVENSLDAGATAVQVIVRDAGRTLLQVIDNGAGMSDTDARMAFERHATSKIREVHDLFTLRTMGFRGEALPSICAVSQVELQSRRAEDEVGTLLEVAGSDVVRQEPCQCPVGTNIKVKNLFFNVPVRRKFLKTDQTELRNILTEFYHIVLVYPKVQFTLVHNDEILLELPVGTEKQRIETVFGKGGTKSYTGQFVDVKTDTDIISVRGFVGKPETAARNAQQYFFVNGRYMRHPYFHKAVMTAYSGMLSNDWNPSYFIYFDVSPELIDVNIHPTKTEIKFQDEQMIFQILLAAVRESLGKFNISPSLDFNRDGECEMPTNRTEDIVASPHVVFDPNYNPFRSTSSRASQSSKGWEDLYTKPVTPPVSSPLEVHLEEEQALFEMSFSDLQLYQYARKFILLPSKLGLLLVNQHRAHIVVLYDQYLRQLNAGKGVSQQLLFPEVVDFTPDDMVLLETVVEELRFVGFDMEQFSKNSYTISGIPALLNSQDIAMSLQRIVHTIREIGGSAVEEWRKQIALSLAKDTAIPYGKQLSAEEMKLLVEQLFALTNYRRTPDGQSVIGVLSDEDIARLFKG